MPPKATATKAKAATVDHASYQDMISDAIINLKDRKGSSRSALKKYVTANNKKIAEGKMFDSLFNRALKAGVDKGVFEQPKGASGGTKLAKKIPKVAAPKTEKTETKKAEAKPAAAKATTKKPAAKKATATKKTAAKPKAAPAAKKAAPKKTAVKAKAVEKPKAAPKVKKVAAPKSAPAIVEKPSVLNKTKSGRVTKTTGTSTPKKAAAKKTAKPSAKKATPKKATPAKKATPKKA